MRSALTRHVMDVRVCANRCASVTPACEVTVRPPSRSRPLLIGWFRRRGLAGFVAWPVVVPPDPSGDPEERQTYGTAPDGPPFSAALVFGVEHFTIGAERFRARRFRMAMRCTLPDGRSGRSGTGTQRVMNAKVSDAQCGHRCAS